MAENMDATGSGEQQEKRGLSRRTVLAGAAWSVPVIAVASAAPAMAASPPVTILFGQSTACTIPGESQRDSCFEKGYVLWARFINESSTDYYVRIDAVVLGLPTDPGGAISQCVVGMTDPFSVTCPPTVSNCMLVPGETDEGTPEIYGVFTNAASESSSDWVTVTLSWFADSACLGTPLGTATLDPALVIGSPWTGSNANGATGGCEIPAGATCFDPPIICGTQCGDLATT